MSELAIWFEVNAMPLITTFSTVLAALLVAIAPLLAAIGKIKKNSAEITKSSATVLAENARLCAENDEYRTKILRQERLTVAYQKDISDIKKMCAIAFTNDKELVVNGYARQINAVLGVEEVSDEEREETDEAQDKD